MAALFYILEANKYLQTNNYTDYQMHWVLLNQNKNNQFSN